MIKKTIKIPLFWKIYIIVVTIVLIGFVVLWSILWTALKKYEQSRPEYAMDKITEQIQLRIQEISQSMYTRGKTLMKAVKR